MDLTLSRQDGPGIRLTTCTWNGLPHIQATARPVVETDAAAQVRALLGRLVEACGGSLVHQTVFVADPADWESCRQAVRSWYGAQQPCTTWVLQPAEPGCRVIIEALALPGAAITYHQGNLTQARQADLQWVWAAPDPIDQPAPAYDQTSQLLARWQALLRGIGVGSDQVIRTWWYLGGILAQDQTGPRYQEFNRARADGYAGIPFLRGLLPAGHQSTAYPASTGIGMHGQGLALSVLAVTGEVQAVPLENPRQISAYRYNAIYGPQSPRFARGLVLIRGNDAMLFVSGTASIVASETRHAGDVAAQTRQTLDHISYLISEANLSRHGLRGLGGTWNGLLSARIYVKRAEDRILVETLCQERWGQVPLVSTQADICRPDLLVEVECLVATARR